MSGVQLLKYALYGLLGFELSQVGAGISNPWFWSILITVIVIENLGIIQSRRF
jgi:hypothetical protein